VRNTPRWTPSAVDIGCSAVGQSKVAKSGKPDFTCGSTQERSGFEKCRGGAPTGVRPTSLGAGRRVMASLNVPIARHVPVRRHAPAPFGAPPPSSGDNEMPKPRRRKPRAIGEARWLFDFVKNSFSRGGGRGPSVTPVLALSPQRGERGQTQGVPDGGCETEWRDDHCITLALRGLGCRTKRAGSHTGRPPSRAR
jgi:hypothetical protein